MFSDFSYKAPFQGIIKIVHENWIKRVGPALNRSFSGDHELGMIIRAELLTEVLIQVVHCCFRYAGEHVLHIPANEARYLRQQGCELPEEFEQAKIEYAKRFDEEWNLNIGMAACKIAVK